MPISPPIIDHFDRRLQEKIKLRQQEKKALEKKEAIEKEKLRRKQGKQLTNMKQQ